MTTFVDFTPSADALFQFQPTLSGAQYVVTCPWNAFGERWYITVSDLAGNVVVHRPIAQSGPRYQAVLTWNNGVATAALSSNHNVAVGQTVSGRVSQSGTPFDGLYPMLAVDAETLTFALAANPQQPVAVTGKVDFPLDLLAGYGIGPLYFHPSTQQFEY